MLHARGIMANGFKSARLKLGHSGCEIDVRTTAPVQRASQLFIWPNEVLIWTPQLLAVGDRLRDGKVGCKIVEVRGSIKTVIIFD